MNAKRFQTWLEQHTGNAGIRQLAAQIGTSHTTIGRQFSGDSSLDPNLVLKLARAYELNVLDALTQAEFITPEEANAPTALAALREVTDVELAREILRRAEESEAMSLPVSEVAGSLGNVIDADARFSAPMSVLADLEGEPYAADTRRDHEDDPVED